jgi:hypothetical protein
VLTSHLPDENFATPEEPELTGITPGRES